MTAGVLPDRLSAKVRMIEESLQRSGVPLRSMKKAGSLETNQTVSQDPEPSHTTLFNIDYLEGTRSIEARTVSSVAPNQTAFRYFLDGTQKTLPIWRLGVTPIVVSCSIVGILERNERGDVRLLPDSLIEKQTWLIPEDSGNPQVEALLEVLDAAKEPYLDPISHHPAAARIDYEATVSQFNRVVDCAYATASAIRTEMEQRALLDWMDNEHREYADGWIVVDGRLHGSHPKSVGLVKQLLTQIVTGADAMTLFDLQQGHRTSSFRIRPREGDDRQGGNTNWYQRFWDADGFDARHGLARIEAPSHVSSPEAIDQIASWLLAERFPRATDDPRWPTLLYPIHLLENILKRRLASITTGWPA